MPNSRLKELRSLQYLGLIDQHYYLDNKILLSSLEDIDDMFIGNSYDPYHIYYDLETKKFYHNLDTEIHNQIVIIYFDKTETREPGKLILSINDAINRLIRLRLDDAK